jgi:hypothetical protein
MRPSGRAVCKTEGKHAVATPRGRLHKQNASARIEGSDKNGRRRTVEDASGKIARRGAGAAFRRARNHALAAKKVIRSPKKVRLETRKAIRFRKKAILFAKKVIL